MAGRSATGAVAAAEKPAAAPTAARHSRRNPAQQGGRTDRHSVAQRSNHRLLRAEQRHTHRAMSRASDESAAMVFPKRRQCRSGLPRVGGGGPSSGAEGSALWQLAQVAVQREMHLRPFSPLRPVAPVLMSWPPARRAARLLPHAPPAPRAHPNHRCSPLHC